MEKPESGMLFSEEAQKIILAYYGAEQELPWPVEIDESKGMAEAERFSKETLIPFPEKSYSEELLDTPISVESRIAHLVPYHRSTSSAHTRSTIAEQVGVTPHWVAQTAARMGIEPLLSDDFGDEDDAVYPELTFELIEEEYEWQKSYEALDDMLSVYRVAEFVGSTHRWVDRKAHDLNIYSVKMKLDRDREVFAYPKTLIPKLRHLLLVIPPQEDWLSLGDLVAATGKGKNWIIKQLESNNVRPEIRRSRNDSREVQHYPSDAVAMIEALVDESPRPAGDWLNIAALAHRLSKSRDWVELRLERNHPDAGEMLLGDGAKPTLHYSPEVLKSLESELEIYDEAGDYLAVRGLASALGKSYMWVSRRLPYVEAEPDVRLDTINRPTQMYAPQTIEALRSLPGNILKTTPPRKS